jgi:uncharacterized protein YbjQ (UPF0145 family)
MRKKLVKHGIAVIGIAVLAFLSISSGASTPKATSTPIQASVATTGGTIGSSSGSVNIVNHGIFGEQIRIPVKDFEAVGLVFTETKYNISNNVLNGNMFTYQALLKEAQKLRADAIINVVIDKKVERILDGTPVRQETWYGSALAIRYTGVLNQNDVYLSNARSYTFTGSNALTTSTEIGSVALSNYGVFGEQIQIPVKNFETAGLVFIDVEYEIDNINGTINGNTFTYNALLKEADKVRGHAIINVVLDKKVERVNNITKEKWYASALAIRYTTNVARREGVILNDARSYTYNGGNPFGKASQ